MRKPIRKVRSAATKSSVTRRSASASKRRTASKANGGKKSASGFHYGEEGFRTGAERKKRMDEQYEKMRETPYDFWLKPGTEAEVVILDKGAPFFATFHKLKVDGRWTDVPCIADSGQRCPLCESTGKQGSYTMVLTVLDRRPYKIKNGPNAGKTIKVSKKLMKVRGRNLPKFERLFKGKSNGDFRGIKVLCHRSGEKEAGIGEDLEFGSRIKESFLAKFGDEAKAADYPKIFELPSASEMRKRYQLEKTQTPGSEEFDDEEDEELESAGWGD